MRMLQIKNLFVQYSSAKNPAIQDVSFDVKKGNHVAILGPSGCGKSTILNAIAGLLEQKKVEIKGDITWAEFDSDSESNSGRSLNGKKKPTIRMVFQESTLLPWRTVEKNIALGLEIQKNSKEEITQKVQEMLSIIGLEEFAKSFPRELSVGMSQRVNFARALVCEPDLLLLDEPFSALDDKTKNTIQQEFARILKEKKITSIFVTHDVQEATSMANKIIVLSKSPSRIERIIEKDVDGLFQI